jgi:hypothetical protein
MAREPPVQPDAQLDAVDFLGLGKSIGHVADLFEQLLVILFVLHEAGARMRA